MMPAVISKICNKILIGMYSITTILHGTEAIYLSNNYLEDPQIEENKALRYTVKNSNMCFKGRIWYIFTNYKRHEIKNIIYKTYNITTHLFIKRHIHTYT